MRNVQNVQNLLRHSNNNKELIKQQREKKKKKGEEVKAAELRDYTALQGLNGCSCFL